ncbi:MULTISPECIES: mannitol dehydrogenase family protein [unclassified Ruegeria]|uniref:mannitol dehydrogenase family protein n=1 Tax=unclassified Ruegeria TaxID=2625375 RepID=UPI0014897D7B|nr:MULTISPECIES: mannitol dehydrogenase family protein [unclassified Ruegeria]NOD61722.1 mannitol dehydrogenase family protein [Ruegeria sp. HKCCD6109]
MGTILHFGLGNFARAHLLDYTDQAGGWDVVGVSLRSSSVRDGLAGQGFEYDLCVQGQGVRRIKALRDVLVAPEDRAEILNVMADAEIISATVTEKGYHLDAAGNLNLQDPAIAADLAGQGPATLIGFLAFGLAERRKPVTVLSCDNRMENGKTLEMAVADFANAAGLDVNWDAVRFPNAMVDRITPATTDAVRAISGDPMAVPTEAFSEWVVEDNFVGPHPDWPGVQLVDDVAPHEMRKLRMLNGAHSLLAYAGLERGLTYVHEAVRDPVLRPLVTELMKDAGATLPAALQVQVPDYAEALLRRFENLELAHRLDQIAMDGSQKLPYRFVPTLRETGSQAVIAGMRAWISFCMSEIAKGRTLNDPCALEIASAVTQPDPVVPLLDLVGAEDLASLIRE